MAETEGTAALAARRTAEMAAMFMIGDGLLGLLQPQRHVALWRSDVAAADALVRPFAGNPGRAGSTGSPRSPPGSRWRPASGGDAVDARDGDANQHGLLTKSG